MSKKKYKHDESYSYTIGMSVTIEMIKKKPDCIIKIYVHPNYIPKNESVNIFNICDEYTLPCEINKRIFDSLAIKGNVFVLGIFEKYNSPVENLCPHIVMVNPSDSGNLGTIMRTGLGFGFKNLVIIKPAVDIYDPKTIRSSMGAFFHMNFSYFTSFEVYMEQFPKQIMYPFMLKGKINLNDIKESYKKPFSLVFGNEATGLDDKFLEYGESIYIKHNSDIDSLNLSVAFGIAANIFSQ